MSKMFEKETGKTTFVFRTEVDDREKLLELIEEATERFVITTEVYKIRVFETSESLVRMGLRKEVFFFTIKIEAVNFRAAALRMSKVFKFLSLMDFGLRSGKRFEISEDNGSLKISGIDEIIKSKGIFRRKLIKA